MARPPRQGKKAVAADIQDLTRILNRAEQDEQRPAKVREQLCGHIREALQILLVGERTGQPVRKTG